MGTSLEIREAVPLAPFTTFRIGGPAQYFAKTECDAELFEALEFAEARGLEVFILGGGSNVLIADQGFDGLVINISGKGVVFEDPTISGDVIVTAMAGEDWDAFVGLCVGNDLAGIECLSGIPGLVGGTPIQNVGAYGQEVSETVLSVRAYDRAENSVRVLSNEECGFRYRASIFNTTEKGRYIVLSVKYALKNDGTPKIDYADLKTRFGDVGPTLAETREAVCRIRASKGMLVRQGGADSRSAGSFFKNPVVGPEEFTEVNRRATQFGIIADGKEVPSYPLDEGNFKIPAAWLIEQSGFPKGYLKGNAGLSTVHTLAITNRGGASAEELIGLKDEIQGKVRDVFGIGLVPEPDFIGFHDSP